MISPKKTIASLAARLALAVFLATVPAAPSYGDKSTTWKLVQSFGRAVRHQESKGRYYLLVLLLAAFSAAAAGFIWYIIQKKLTSNKKTGLESENNSQNSHQEPGSTQKRALLRISLKKDLFFAQEDSGEFIKGEMIDLSGGGVQFATSRKLEPDEILRISFELGPGKKFNLKGRVVRVVTEPCAGNESRFLIGAQFLNIKRSEQDSIVNIILQEQQKRRGLPRMRQASSQKRHG